MSLNPTPTGPTAPLNTAEMAVNPQMITFFGRSVADLPPNAVVNEYAAMAIPAFYSGVRFIVETMASLPKAVYLERDNSRVEQRNHAVTRILQRAINPIQIPFVFWETLFHHAVVWGNAYGYVKRDAGLNPQALYNLSPEQVTPFLYTKDGSDEPSKWFWVRGAGRAGEGQVVSAADMIHIPGLGFDGLCGYPVVYLLSETLEASRNAAKYGRKYLKKGTQVRGSIEVPGSMTQQQIEGLQDRLRRQHSGLDDSSLDTLILTNGAKMSNNTVPPEQSQLLQTMNFSVTDVCRVLRIPPHVVYQLDRATWANIEYLGIEVVKYSLGAWITKGEQATTMATLSTKEQDAGLRVRMSVDYLEQGDTKTLSETTLAKVNGGIITPNEGRRVLGQPPDPDPLSDKLRIPVNVANAGATKPVDPAPANTLPPPDPAPKKRKKSARDRDGQAELFKKLRPLLDEAAGRVDHKAELAFENRRGKPAAEQIPWLNVFADQQKQYATYALTPAAVAIAATTGRTVDVEKISVRYANALRASRSTGVTPTLKQLLQESIDGQEEKP